MLRKVFTRLMKPGGALCENALATQLYHNLSLRNFRLSAFGGLEKYTMTDVVSLPNEHMQLQFPDEALEEFKDFLVKDVQIRGVKKFPAKDVYYSLNFSSINSHPMSSVVMGLNGAGKSSFYGALEMIGMATMNTARLHNMEWRVYLPNYSELLRDIQIIAHTPADTLIVDTSDPKPHSFPAFYTSEWDIREIEGLENFGSFVYHQIGISDFADLISLLEETNMRVNQRLPIITTNINELATLRREIDIISGYIKEKMSYSDIGMPDDLSVIVDSFEGDDKSVVNIFATKQKLYTKKNLEITIEDLLLLKITDPSAFLQNLDDITTALKSEFNILMTEWVSQYIQPILNGLLDEYLKDDDYEIEISYIPNQRNISVRLVRRNQNDTNTPIEGEISPRRLFNTFRLKLFAVSLKVACACCAKKIYNLNFPIVIDDVFNSSDFDNRLKMSDYIISLYSSYSNLPEVSDMPLQIILFTQDDVIANSIYSGLEEIDADAKLLRLHDYRSFNKASFVKISDDISFIDVFSEVACHQKGN